MQRSIGNSTLVVNAAEMGDLLNEIAVKKQSESCFCRVEALALLL